jgi:hypothetical protein
MANYRKSFDFNPGSLGVNLADFDHKVDRYIDRAKEEAATRGETALKTEAPWRDRTTDARRGLFAEPYGTAQRGGIRMGHTVKYGVYLEEANNGRFQVIMPVLIRTGRALMRSMEAMFAEMDSPTPVAPVIIPGGGGRQGTSQSPERQAYKKPRAYFRDARGRFVSQKTKVVSKVKDTTKRTKRTRRA